MAKAVHYSVKGHAICRTRGASEVTRDVALVTCSRCRQTAAWRKRGHAQRLPTLRWTPASASLPPRPPIPARPPWDPSLEVVVAAQLFLFGDAFGATRGERRRQAVEDARAICRLVYEGDDEPPLSSLPLPDGVPPGL